MTYNELLELDKQAQAKPTGKASAQPSRQGDRASSKSRQRPEAKMRAAKGGARQPANHDAVTPRDHGVMTPSMLERLRKAVKQVGKEGGTHRLTRQEKQSLADIVYTYRRQGYRTSENEITRIGVNWLIEDYQENGKHSVLHRVLRALKE